MYKLKSTLGLCLFLTVILLTMTGCKSKRMVYADYVMPPKVITDVSQIKLMTIAKPSISLSAKGLRKRAQRDVKDVFANTIVNDISSQLYYCGYVKTTDNIYGNIHGLKTVASTLARSKHGYDVKLIPANRSAKMVFKTKLYYERTKGRDKINTVLNTINYTTKYNDNGVPYAAVSSHSSKVVTSRVSYINVKVKGSLTCTIYDHRGKKLYSRTFDDLEFENKSGGDSGSKAEPPYPEIAQSVFRETINKIASDISPHKETRALVVNSKGDSSVVTLIKGTAFSDAYEKLSKIIDKEEESIEKKSAEINTEYDQLIAEEADAEKKAALEVERKNELISANSEFSPDYENMGIILEILGDRNEALEYYTIAAELDPENTSAKDSSERVAKMISASDLVNDKTKIDNYLSRKIGEN